MVMMNFLGALQPLKKTAEGKLEALKRVCGSGQCKNHADAKKQLQELYKREYPDAAEWVDDDKSCLGGVFVFECTPYELIEKAANEESADMIRAIYDDAIELSPFVEQ
jgi:hypothetical protein